MTSKKRVAVFIFLIIGLLIFTTACSDKTSAPNASSKEDILIGFAAPMTGDAAMEGQNALKAVQLAVEECNAAGGINGRKIVIVQEDDKGDSKEAASVAQKFASNDKIMAIIGHDYSSCHMVAGPIYQAAGIPSIVLMASSPKVVDVGDTVFRTCANDDIAGKVNGAYIAKNMGVKKLAVIFDNTEYGVSYSNALKKEAAAQGCEIVANESFVSGQDRDFTIQLTKIKDAKPEALFISAYVSECGLIADQARKLGLDCRFYVPNTANSQFFLDLAKGAAEGTIISTYFDRNVEDNVAKAFCEKYEARWKEDTFYICPYAYDNANIIIEALKRCSTINRANLLAEIKKTDYKGVTGSIQFNEKGDRNSTLNIMLEVKDGKFVIRDTLKDVS